MDIILIPLQKVKTCGRIDFDFYNPNHKDLTDSLVKGYATDMLGNICLKITAGKTAPRNAYPERGVRIIKVKNISGHGIKWGEYFFVTSEFYEKAKKKSQVQAGDMLMLCSAHNKSYIGRVDIIDAFPSEVSADDSRCCCVGELIIIRANPQKVLPEYLITFFRLPVVQEQIRRMVKGQSAHLYPKDLMTLDVVLPPKEVQEKIAELNAIAEHAFALQIRETNEALARSREQIEQLILSGRIL